MSKLSDLKSLLKSQLKKGKFKGVFNTKLNLAKYLKLQNIAEKPCK